MAIEKNSVVAISYEVKDAKSGELIDSNIDGDPLEFLMGSGHIVPGLEKAIAAMSAGEAKNIVVSADQAYGSYDETAQEQVEIDQFSGIDLQTGMTLYGQSESGQTVQVTVKAIGEKEVTIDYNHPLAGKDLSFAVTVLSTREATSEEIENQSLAHECCCGDDHEHGHKHGHNHCGCDCH
ncbi:peptidyl-prolyl cis-trans isomerase [Campylobacterota bacterium]|nr:peptidyl-prolyl cis-trans isomerase [Campylobacterota bacterium]